MADGLVAAVAGGIPFTLDTAALDDFEVLEYLARMADGDAVAAVPFCRAVFGAEQLSNIKDSLRDADGRCRSSVLLPWVLEAVDAAAAAKGAEAKN